MQEIAQQRKQSLSARRAWIEITAHTAKNTSIASLSARRAWIEIKSSIEEVSKYVVALRKESVDRNAFVRLIVPELTGRSPQGERG